MIKVTTAKPIPSPRPDVIIQMSPAEAMFLRMILGNIGGDPTLNPLRKLAFELYTQLTPVVDSYAYTDSQYYVERTMLTRNL